MLTKILCILVIASVSACLGRGKPPACEALAAQGAHVASGRCVVDGDVTTRDYKESRLPENLTVGGDLQIYGCGVNSLPKGLRVGKSIDLYKSCVTRLPPDLVVGGNVDSQLAFGDDLLSCKDIPKTARIGGWVRCE